MITTVAPSQCDIPRNPPRLDTLSLIVLIVTVHIEQKGRKDDYKEKQSIQSLQPSRDILSKKENQSDKKISDSCIDDSNTIHDGSISDLTCSRDVTPVVYVPQSFLTIKTYNVKYGIIQILARISSR